jgi:hypothetical protein
MKRTWTIVAVAEVAGQLAVLSVALRPAGDAAR